MNIYISNSKYKKIIYYDRLLGEYKTIYDVYVHIFGSKIYVYLEDENYIIDIFDIVSVEK